MMLGTAALVIGGFALAHLFLTKTRDPETLCIPGDERGQTIVLVDKTDKWNDNQSDRLEKHILDVLNDDMQQEERLRVFAFGATFAAGFKETFTACKPPDGRNCSGIFCNPRQLREQYKVKFLEPLLAELKTLKIATRGDCSPIAEVLVEVLGRKEVKAQPGATRVVLISDMAQNTPIYTAFRGQMSCPGVSGRIDPDTSTGLIDYFRRYQRDIRVAQTTAFILQVKPEGRTPDIPIRAKRKWEEVFRLLGIPEPRWESL